MVLSVTHKENERMLVLDSASHAMGLGCIMMNGEGDIGQRCGRERMDVGVQGGCWCEPGEGNKVSTR